VTDVANKENENVQPGYVGRETLAKLLDCAPSTVDKLVERGVLPRPYSLLPNCVRWRWAECDLAVQALNNPSAVDDPFLARVKENAELKKTKNRD
jgi:predicted DNA-binding transcriptional regulator AlpA